MRQKLGLGLLAILHGADDMIGWCLSTDATDGNNSECSGVGTHLGWDFPVSPIFGGSSPLPLD